MLFKLVFISHGYHESPRGKLFLKHSVVCCTVLRGALWCAEGCAVGCAEGFPPAFWDMMQVTVQLETDRKSFFNLRP